MLLFAPAWHELVKWLHSVGAERPKFKTLNNTFTVGLPQPAYASARDMSVQTVHRAGKQSTLYSPIFRSSPDDIDDILAARQPISIRLEVDPPPP